MTHGCQSQQGGAAQCCVAAIAEALVSCEIAAPPCLLFSDATLKAVAATVVADEVLSDKRREKRSTWSQKRLAERRATYGDLDDDGGAVHGMDLDCQVCV